MMNLLNYLIILVVLVVGCNGLNCYNCTACTGGSNSWGTSSNSASNASCTKYSYTYSVFSAVNRGSSINCISGADNLGGTWYCCQTDLCNQSVSLSSSLILIFTLITAVRAFKNQTNN